MTTYVVSEDALKQASSLGFFGNVQSRIERMALNSAPYTSDEGNRRFEGYVMQITDGLVESIDKIQNQEPSEGQIEPDTTAAASDIPASYGQIVCPDCEDDGGTCATCNSTGQISEERAKYLA